MECERHLNKLQNPIMANLQDCRLATFAPYFYFTGVDYFESLFVEIGRAHQIRCGSLFICMTTRAIHLVVVESFDTNSFLKTLLRFINRHIHPETKLSHCGSNFKGADTELKQDAMREFAAT